MVAGFAMRFVEIFAIRLFTVHNVILGIMNNIIFAKDR
jgi:hypothetical protein